MESIFRIVEVQSWTMGKPFHGTFLFLEYFFVLHSSTLCLPIVVSGHGGIDKFWVHNRRLIRMLVVVSEVLSLIINEAFAILLATASMSLDNVGISTWTIWRIIYSWNFSTARIDLCLWAQICTCLPALRNAYALHVWVLSVATVVRENIFFSSGTSTSKCSIFTVFSSVYAQMLGTFYIHYFILF